MDGKTPWKPSTMDDNAFKSARLSNVGDNDDDNDTFAVTRSVARGISRRLPISANNTFDELSDNDDSYSKHYNNQPVTYKTTNEKQI
jgi:hypothetical protein